jgi:hypothetical protein
MKKAQIFGLQVESELELTFPMIAGVGKPDLTIRLVDRAPAGYDASQLEPRYRSPQRNRQGKSVLHLYRQDGIDLLHYPELVNYFLLPDQILVQPLSPGRQAQIEIYLLGTVLSFWLELRGLPVLHASAVVVRDGAVAFLATNYGGKSSLAAALMQSGAALLSDDVLPLERATASFLAYPAYPCMRLWPEEASYFTGRETLPYQPVMPGSPKLRLPVGEAGIGDFCATPQPLVRIYVPERRDPGDSSGGIEIRAFSGHEALMSLLSKSFAARLTQAAGLSPQRLAFFAGLLEMVPIYRLAYPSGFDQLPQVRRAVLDDLLAAELAKKAHFV